MQDHHDDTHQYRLLQMQRLLDLFTVTVRGPAQTAEELRYHPEQPQSFRQPRSEALARED
jgi:hypothetical protein